MQEFIDKIQSDEIFLEANGWKKGPPGIRKHDIFGFKLRKEAVQTQKLCKEGWTCLDDVWYHEDYGKCHFTDAVLIMG